MLGRGEVKRRQPGDQPAIHLFRKWAERVARPQTRLYMTDGYASMKCCQGSGECRARVSLHQHEVRALLIEDGVERVENPRAHLARRLAGGHNLHVAVDTDIE